MVESLTPTYPRLYYGLSKDMMTLILQKLSDEDLENLRKLSCKTIRILNDDNFWRQRTLNRFARYFTRAGEDVEDGTEEMLIDTGFVTFYGYKAEIFEKAPVEILTQYREKFADTWQQYYLRITSFMESFQHSNHEDLLYFLYFYNINSEELLDSFINEDSFMEIVNRDFVDVNILLDFDKVVGQATRFFYISEETQNKILEKLEDKYITLVLSKKKINIKPVLGMLLKTSACPKLLDIILTDPRTTVEVISDILLFCDGNLCKRCFTSKGKPNKERYILYLKFLKRNMCSSIFDIRSRYEDILEKLLLKSIE